MVSGRLAGSVALITGATSGIGLACAELFAREGACVVLAGRRAALGARVAADISNQGLRAMFVETDVSRAADCERLARTAVGAFGRLDIVVSNAAVMDFASVEVSTEERWDRVLDTNLKGAFLISHFAIPQMRRAGGGQIVFMSSAHAMASQEGFAAYAASKGGLLALARQMAVDLAKDAIRVNALVVGAVDAPMHHEHIAAMGETEESIGLSRDPRALGRVANPIEIARAALFLASDDSSFITGTSLVCDGGRLAKL